MYALLTVVMHNVVMHSVGLCRYSILLVVYWPIPVSYLKHLPYTLSWSGYQDDCSFTKTREVPTIH